MKVLGKNNKTSLLSNKLGKAAYSITPWRFTVYISALRSSPVKKPV